MAVDEARRVGREKDGGADQFIDIAPPPHRRAAGEPGGKFFVLDQRLVEFGAEIAGRDGVDPQSVLAQSVAMPLVSIFTPPFEAL